MITTLQQYTDFHWQLLYMAIVIACMAASNHSGANQRYFHLSIIILYTPTYALLTCLIEMPDNTVTLGEIDYSSFFFICCLPGAVIGAIIQITVNKINRIKSDKRIKKKLEEWQKFEDKYRKNKDR